MLLADRPNQPQLSICIDMGGVVYVDAAGKELLANMYRCGADLVASRCRMNSVVTTRERLYDFLENDGQIYVGGWRWILRCQACSHVTAWVVAPNRQFVNRPVVVAS